MRVLYFGELDPYSGTFPQDLVSLPRLIKTLKLLCFAYDVVVLPPGSLIEHGLALPALEALAPLVRAGRLGTSADYGAPLPPVYFKNRIERHFDGLHPSRRIQAWRKGECERLVGRWLRILPADWPVRRDVAGQVSSTQELVLGELAAAPGTPFAAAAAKMDWLVRDALERGNSVDRDRLLMLIASIRNTLSVEEMAYATTLVQGAYFHAGPVLHDVGEEPGSSCKIYPGGFRRSLERQASHGARLRIQHPFAEDVLGPTYGARAARVGIDLARLASLPPGDIADIVATDHWRTLTRFLRGEAPATARDEVAAVLRGRDVRDQLHRIPVVRPHTVACRHTPEVAPSLCIPTWGAGARATLGAGYWSGADCDNPRDRATRRNSRTCVFEWASRTLSFAARSGDPPGPSVRLSPAHAHLLTLLAVSGDVGVSIDEAQRALVEIDVDASQAVPHPPRLRTGEKLDVHQDRVKRTDSTLRNRVDVAKTALARILSDFQRGITTVRGRMRLEPAGVRVVNTPWAPVDESAAPAVPSLKGRIATVWNVLHSSYPNEVGVETIAAALAKSDSKARTRYVSQLVHRLEHALRDAESPWKVQRDYSGHYRLAIMPPSE